MSQQLDATGTAGIGPITRNASRISSNASSLLKSSSYVNAVLGSPEPVLMTASAPESADVSTNTVPSLKKFNTIAADDILAQDLLPVSESFCTKYLNILHTKSSSAGPRTPMGSPGVSLSSLDGMATPPVNSLCPLVNGPLAASVPEMDSLPTVLEQLGDTNEVPEETDKTREDSDAKPEEDTNQEIGEVDEANIETVDNSTKEEEEEEEAMDTEEQAEDNAEGGDDQNEQDVQMDTTTRESREGLCGIRQSTEDDNSDSRPEEVNLTPLPPMLSPVRSFTSGGDAAAATTSGEFPPPPGHAPVQIAFSFDTTGSMSQCLDELRAQLRDVITRLLGDVPGLQVAVIAHGDYCDEKEYYLLKCVDFTNDVNKLTEFVNEAGGTGGGDWEECYEYVLYRARALSWTSGAQRALVMIGDAVPHDKDYPLNTLQLDWKEQALFLSKQMGVNVYAVQCVTSELDRAPAAQFWTQLAHLTGGRRITMEAFSTVVDLMLAVCYRETAPEFLQAYEKEVRMREARGLNKDLAGMFETLRDEPADDVIIPAGFVAGKRTKMVTRKTTPPKRVVAVRKKPSAARKAGESGRLKKSCSCIMCDGRASGAGTSASTSGVGAEWCSCVECWWKTTQGADVTKPPRNDCTCIMCGGAAKPRRVLPKGTKRIAGSKSMEPKSHPKKLRESVAEGRFAFRDFRWSPWRLAMIPAPTGSATVSKNWEPCAWNSGVMRTDLFKLTNKPAVYEVAVQPGKGRVKNVVYCYVSKGLKVKKPWANHILPRALCVTVLDQSLKSNCNVYVRVAPIGPQRKSVKIGAKRHPISSPHQIKTLMVKTYDYAWQRRRNQDGRLATRLLTRGNVVISGTN